MSDDIFTKYGGASEATTGADAFAAYGGTTDEHKDPFAAYGGASEDLSPIQNAALTVGETMFNAGRNIQNFLPDLVKAGKVIASNSPGVAAMKAVKGLVTGDHADAAEGALDAVDTGKAVGEGLVKRGEELGVGEALTGHPVEAGKKLGNAFVKNPVYTILDVASVAFPAAEGLKTISTARKLGRLAEIEGMAGKVAETAEIAAKDHINPLLLEGPKPTVEGPLQLKSAVKVNDKVYVGNSHEVAGQAAKEQLALVKSGDEAGSTTLADAVKDPKNKGFVDQNGKFYTLEEAQPLINQGTTNPFDNKGFTMSEPTKQYTGGENPNVVEHPNRVAAYPTEQVAREFEASAQGKFSKAVAANDLPPKFTPGAVERLGKVGEHLGAGEVKDIDFKMPGVNDRTRVDTALGGEGNSVWFKQREAGFKQSELAREEILGHVKDIGKFGFEENTPEAMAIKIYGEAANKDIAFGGIKKEFGLETANKIKAAADHMRQVFDHYWVENNKVRVANGQQPLAYRQDYFTHGQEFSLMQDLGLTDLTQAQKQLAKMKEARKVIDGDTRFVKLRNVVFNFTKRLAGEDNLDAIAGYKRYVSSSANLKHMQPYVNELHATADLIKGTAPKAAKYLTDQANYLAGLPNKFDSDVIDVTSQKFLRAYSQSTKNMVGNIVTLNPKIAVSQLMGEIPSFANYPLKDFIASGHKIIRSPEFRDFAMANSSTLRDRALDLLERNVDAGLIRKANSAILNFSDVYVAMHGWGTAYLNAIRKGSSVEDAIAAAENFTAKAQGFTSRVNTPPLLRSKAFQSLAPLQNQSTAFTHFIVHDLWAGKTVTEKTLAAFKLAIAGTTAAMADYAVFGKMGGGIVQLTDFIPMSGTLRHGLGGPVLGSLGRIAAGANTGDPKKVAEETLTAGMLLQNKVPGGLMISKVANKGLKYLLDNK
jgi:hypothetical protein